MNYKTHVGLVYSHPESDCCNYDIHIVFYEEILVSASFGIGKACMIWKSFKTCKVQFFCKDFYIVPALAVDNSGFSSVPEQIIINLGKSLFFWSDLVIQVFPVETGHVGTFFRRDYKTKLRKYIFPNSLRSSSRKRYDGYPRKTVLRVSQQFQFPVLGPKVVPPLGNAMSFVNCKEVDLSFF
ncbi:MAG: hypothetical protein QG646_3043 [Euryarchaeota archaeon]|nr:hypothetical protein [Euryarchaeota archaeon]